MTTEETELTFIRCPSCRSLVPSIATRCRMCGHHFEKKAEGPAEAGDQVPDAGQSPSRVRQRTISATPDEVDTIKREINAESAASSRAAPTGGAFRLGGAPQQVEKGARSGGFSREDEISVLETTTRSSLPEFEAEEPSAEESARDLLSRIRVDESDDSTFGEEIDSEYLDSISASSTTTRASVQENEVVDETADEFDESEEDFESEEDDSVHSEAQTHGGFRDQPSGNLDARPEGKRKRRRRRKKRGTQTQLSGANATDTGGTPQNADHSRGSFTHQERNPSSTSISQPMFAKQPPVHAEPRREERRDPRREDIRREEPRREEHPREENRGSSSRLVALAEGQLLGWLVSFDADPQGVATEIRSGRFFVGRQRLRPGDFVLEDPSISTPHCMVSAGQAEGLFIQDLMSERGTFLKRKNADQFAQIHNSVAVEHGDYLKFGSHEVLVCLLPTSARQTRPKG